MTDAHPTPQDIANAATRQQIAARQAHEYGEALALALTALGPGDWQPWMKLSLIDADHRRTGDTTPVAVVYKVATGEQRLSENSVFLRRMPDGTVQQASSYEALFGDLLKEKHPMRTVEIRGEQVPVARYELCWAALELYQPRTAEQLAEARVKREAKAIEKMAQENPLFAEQIRSGEYRVEKKPRHR